MGSDTPRAVDNQSVVSQLVDAHGPLIAIGAGFGRTGTKSLKEALEIIYGRPCYHGFELINRHPNHASLWIKVDQLVSESKDGTIAPGIFYKIFDGYRCATDFPTCSYYRQLMDAYPGVKVILTTRNSKTWLESARATIFLCKPHHAEDWAEKVINALYFGWRFTELCDVVFKRALGQNIDLGDDQMVLDSYESWNMQVKQTVPPDQLLVFNVKEGWAPLCAFLNVPLPNQPFPNSNQRIVLDTANTHRIRLSILLRWSVIFSIGFLGSYLFHGLIMEAVF